MTFRDALCLWRERKENPLWVHGRPRRWLLYAISVILLLFAPVIFVPLAVRDSEFAVLFGVLFLYPTFCVLTFHLLASPLDSDARLAELHLTELKKKEVAFGLVALPFFILILTPLMLMVVSLFMTGSRHGYDEWMIPVFSIMTGMNIGAAIIALSRWIDRPRSPARFFLGTNIEYFLRVLAAIPIFLAGLVAIRALMGSRFDDPPIFFWCLVFSIVLPVYTLKRTLVHIGEKLFRRVDLVTWENTSWRGSERKEPVFSPARKQYLREAAVTGSKVYFQALIAVGIVSWPILWMNLEDSPSAYQAMTTSIYSMVVTSVLSGMLVPYFLRRKLGHTLQPGGYVRSLVALVIGIIPAILLHYMAIAILSQVFLDYGMSADQFFSGLLTLLLLPPLFATVVSSVLCSRRRRLVTICWLLYIVLGILLFVTRMRTGYGRLFVPRGQNGHDLMLIFAAAIGGYGLSFSIPRSLQRYWSEQRVQARSFGEDAEAPIAPGLDNTA